MCHKVITQRELTSLVIQLVNITVETHPTITSYCHVSPVEHLQYPEEICDKLILHHSMQNTEKNAQIKIPISISNRKNATNEKRLKNEIR